MDPNLVSRLQQFIAIADACHRPHDPSYSWHILAWMSYHNRLRWLLVRKSDQIINMTDFGC